jgi:hypothetical protein
MHQIWYSEKLSQFITLHVASRLSQKNPSCIEKRWSQVFFLIDQDKNSNTKIYYKYIVVTLEAILAGIHFFLIT